MGRLEILVVTTIQTAQGTVVVVAAASQLLAAAAVEVAVVKGKSLPSKGWFEGCYSTQDPL